jgi:hypothetical protein
MKGSKNDLVVEAEGFPQWWVTGFNDTFVLNGSALLLLNFSAKICHCGKFRTFVRHFRQI